MIVKVMDAVTGAAGKAVGSPGIGELTSGATDAVQKGVSGATDRFKKSSDGTTGTHKKMFGN